MHKRSVFCRYTAMILIVTMVFGPMLAEAAYAQRLKEPRVVLKEDPYRGRPAVQALQDSHAEVLALLKLEKTRLVTKVDDKAKISKNARKRLSELIDLSLQADQDFSVELEDRREELRRAKVPAEIRRRFEAFRQEYRKRSAKFLQSLHDVTRKPDKASVEEAIGKLEASPRAKTEGTEGRTKTGRAEIPSRFSRTLLGLLDFVCSEACAAPVDFEPAAPGEVEIFPSPAVKDLASSLEFNPYLLFQYVRDEIAYEPYAGTLKTPKETMATKKANAVDQAALLTALYLASNIPTKLVRGDIFLPVDEVANWFGGIDVSSQDKKNALWHSLDEHGIDYEVESLNNRRSSHVRLEDHVWVEAKVDYFPYRAKRQSGTAPEAHDNEADLWVALDPSFNQYSYEEDADPSTALGLNSVDFLQLVSRNSIENSTSVGEGTVSSVLDVNDEIITDKIDSYRNSLLDYASAIGRDLEDLFGQDTPALPQLGVLPSTLQAAVDEGTHQIISASDVANLRTSISIQISDLESGDTIVEYSTQTNLILDGNIALSYIPAGTEDEDFLKAWQEPYTIPLAGLAHLKPVLRVAGKSIEGSSVTMGTRQRVTVTLSKGESESTSAERLLTAGGYYAIVLDSRHLSEESLLASSAAYREVQEAVSAEDATATTTQSLGDILGQGLSLAGEAFLYQMDDYLEYASEDLHLAAGRRPSVLLVGYDLKTTSVFGLPYEVSTESVSFDLLLDRYPAPSLAAALDGDITPEEVTFEAAKALSNSALQGSVLDFFLEDENTTAQGISALKLLAIANEQSIPIHAATNEEQLQALGIEDSRIAYFASYKLDPGNITLVFPETVITAGDWTGLSYIAINTNNYDTEAGVLNERELDSFFTLGAWAVILTEHARSVGLPEDPLWPADLVVAGTVEHYTNFVNPVSRAGGLFAHAKNNIAWSYIPAILTVSDWYGERENLARALTHVASAIALTGPVEETGKAPILLYASMEPLLFDPSQSPGLEQQGKLRVYFDREADWGVEVRKRGEPDPVYPDPEVAPVVQSASDKILMSIPTAVTGTGNDGNYFFDGEYDDGRYVVSVTAGVDIGGKFYSIRPWEEEFEIDTRAPEVGLKLLPEPTGSLTGTVTVLGKAADPHLSEWELFYQEKTAPSEYGPMQLLASGDTALNATGALTVWDTAEMNLKGDYRLVLAATDTLGHATSTTSQVYAFANDNVDPWLAWNVEPASPATSSFPVSATARDVDSGLVRFEFYLETEAGETLLSEDLDLQLYPMKGTRTLSATVSLTGFRIPHVPYDLTVRAVAEDYIGNVTTIEKTVQLDSHFWNVYAEPPVFVPDGIQNSYYGMTRIYANKADNVASKVKIYYATDVAVGKEIATCTDEKLLAGPPNPYELRIDWDGMDESDNAVETAHYVARLSKLNAGFSDPDTVDVDVWVSSVSPFGKIVEPASGAIIAVTEAGVPVMGYVSYPLFWDDPQSFPLLDKPREIPRPFWKVEYKPHSLEPVYPLSGTQIPAGKDYMSTYDDTHLNWTLINYGFHRVDPDGPLGEWDVSKLPDGFYDLRFVTSDGVHYMEYVVVGLKVIRSRPGSGGGERNLGTPGRNLLAETDMEIPLFGYDASITRSYDSYDTLTPGDFGYGWRMQKFGVGIERVELPHVKGEYEEVYVTLPDGREFFFANAPNQDNACEPHVAPNEDGFWENNGYYAVHPYGIKMWRPGASKWTGISGCGSGNGSSVELWNDDGTKYFFSWPNGRLSSIQSVEGNAVTFNDSGDQQTIRDSYDRQIRIERETVPIEGVGNVTRIAKATDPTGKHWFEYSYDGVNNLVQVAEKTANVTRLKWFHYGELEVDGETVYYPIHYLTEMIVDTNGNGIEDDGDQRTTFAYDEEGRLEEVESPAGKASMAYETYHDTEGEYLGGSQTVTDELTGAVTTIDHDISGNATEVQDPMGLTTTNEFYTEEGSGAIPGALKRTIDPQGIATDYIYDTTALTTGSPRGMAAALTMMLTNQSPPQAGYLTSTVAQPAKVITDGVTTMENNLHLAESDAANGKLSKPIDTTDATEITTDFTYDSKGHLATVARSNIEFVTTTYYTSGQFQGRVETEVDQNGNITHYDYEIHPSGTGGYSQWIEKTTVTSHYQRAVADRLTTTAFRDALGRTLESTNERGVTTRSKYDFDGRVIHSFTIYEGDTLSRTDEQYNPDGSPKSTTVHPAGANARTTSYYYDKVGRTICTVFPDDNWTATRHYPEKEPIQLPEGMDSEIYSEVWGSAWPQGVDGWQGRATVSYESDGRIEVSKEDLAGRGVESYTLVVDNDEHLQKRGTRTEYNSKGQAWRSYRITGVDGYDRETLLTSTYYDSDGRLAYTKSEIDGINTAEYGYDPDNGRNIWTRAANGIFSTNAYDDEGRIVRVHSGIESATAPSLDSGYYDGTLAGTDSFLADIRGETDETYVRYVFDDLGKVIYQVSPNDDVGEATTAYVYDSEGRQTKVIHNYVDGSYNAGADGTDNDIAYETSYDKYGQRAAIKDAAGHYTWFWHDNFGRVYRKILDADGDSEPPAQDVPYVDPDDVYEEYLYDNARGLLTSRRNYDGGVISYQYHDLTDQKTKETYPDDLEIAYEYDSQGRLVSVVEEKDGVTRRTAINHDPVTGHPSRIAKPEGTLNYSYNELGSLSRVHESAGSGVDYMYYYTLGGRLDTVITPSGETKYEYEDWGSRKRQTLTNGVVTDYTYDNLLRVSNIHHTLENATAEFTYSVGQTGRRLNVAEQISGTSVTIAYSYDGLGRLLSADRNDDDSGDRSFTYDVVGNRLSRTDGSSTTTTYEYNALDQLTAAMVSGSTTRYTYDDNGNLASKDDGTDLTTYHHDSRNRLARVYDGEESSTNLGLAYAYDFAGNLAAKRQYTSGIATKTTGFLIDNNNLTGYSQTFCEYDGDTSRIERLYEYGADLTADIDVTDSSTPAFQYSVYDGLGTTRALTNSDGEVGQTFHYTPFGEGLGHPATPGTKYLFTGEANDSELGLYHLRARMYDAAIGRFTSFDSVEDVNNRLHKYSYVGQEPITGVDPSGEMSDFSLASLRFSAGVIAGLAADFAVGHAVEYLRTAHGTSVAATWVVISYDQYDNLPLWAQIAVTGLSGVGKELAVNSARRLGRRVNGEKLLGEFDQNHELNKIATKGPRDHSQYRPREDWKPTKGSYEDNYLRRYGPIPEEYQVHHGVPQEYEHLFTQAELNNPGWLRAVHRSDHGMISGAWRKWGNANRELKADKEAVKAFANKIDSLYAKYYYPPDVKGVEFGLID